ncbi:TetR/AcrR family transcriptional regulator [Streptomyces albicerus]|uniref:TetR/AcrR family transcriptional regulator n=1 Tax=Streptomyces albicerus TaxID=2569859 RepID=UPI00124BC545|nr:TetR/AcrR family transcriptional regulator [Streptomyces albicerus]
MSKPAATPETPATTATKPAKRRSSAQTREHLLQVAHDLFYWHGIRAVGVDRIAAEAGVAPTTLYRLFASKDDLIAAYVERGADDYREWFTAATRADGRGVRERILALFDALLVQIRPDQCRGCPFLMSLAELPEAGHAGHRQAVALKQWVREQLGELTEELAGTAPLADPSLLADQLTLVMEGTYASVQALGVDGPARQARAFAEALLPDADHAEEPGLEPAP